MLQELCKCDSRESYVLSCPQSWMGALKFKMVSMFGADGATLYHKLREGIEAVKPSNKINSRSLLLRVVTLKRVDGDRYIIAKCELRKVQQDKCSTQLKVDWSQLMLEASRHRRTLAPPTHMHIKAHANYEARKLCSTKRQAHKQPGGLGQPRENMIIIIFVIIYSVHVLFHFFIQQKEVNVCVNIELWAWLRYTSDSVQ